MILLHGIGPHDANKMGRYAESQRRFAAELLPAHFARASSRWEVDFAFIEWHTPLHTGAGLDALYQQLSDGSQRAFAMRHRLVPMLLDGYMYLSPPFKQLILGEISAQLNAKYYEYCAAHPDFSGKVTLLAHSLGGVAAFDLLAHQHLLDGAYPPLGFPVSNLVLIGSPLPLFLELRRECGERREAWPSETRLFNVFHPADPLGFLLEPSLMAVRVVGDGGAADAVAVVEAEAAADGGDDGDAAVPAGGDAEATEAERLAAAAARAAAAAQERRRAAHRALRVRLLLAAEEARRAARRASRRRP